MDKNFVIKEKDKEKWQSKHYGIAGNHSGVQICSWTKKALRGEGVCYKQKFYGVDTHRCVEMSPAMAWCQQNCTFCWRPMEYMRIAKVNPNEVDDPEDIIKEVLEARRVLLTGFGGNKKVDKLMLEEAMNPTHFAISLSGEPTLYPKIIDLISELKKRKETKSIFLVTNAQEPEVFEDMISRNEFPTQLYVSLDAPNEEIFKRVNHSIYKDGWDRLKRSLKILKNAKARRVIRFTLIKGLNDADEYLDQYKEILELIDADFIEVKAYMFLGYSRNRLKMDNMPLHEDVVEFASKLAAKINYNVEDEHIPSRIVLLKNKKTKFNNRLDFEN